MQRNGLLVSFLYIFTFSIAFAQSPVIALQEFSVGYSSPIDIRNCGDSRLFIVQQNGYIYIADSSGIKLTTPFLDIHTKISQSSERGLLGLAFHPSYLDNGFFYVYYTRLTDGHLRISRFSADSLNENLADPNSELILMEIPHPTFNNHNGGCLQFGPDGYLYIGTGDGGSAGDPNENAQNTVKHLGKMLRLDVDSGSPYAVPADNPFVGDPDNYYPEIWAFGLRNPWRYSFDRITGDLWIADVGQNTWEEIDFMPMGGGGGQNYGWDCYEGTHNYEPANCPPNTILTYPVYEYQHSSGSNGDCSVTGGYVYRGAQYENLFGKYLFVDYCSGKFRATTQNTDGTFTSVLVGDEVIVQDEFSFSSIGEDYLGELYVTDVTHGKIYKLTDTACVPTAHILVNGMLPFPDSTGCTGSLLQAISGTGLTYQWQLNGTDIAGATANNYTANGAGMYTLQVTNTTGCENISKAVSVGVPTIPEISGNDSIYCSNQSADILIGIPTGGVYSGNGINGNTFDPVVAGIGSHLITYTYENEYGCIESTAVTVDVVVCTDIAINTLDNNILLFPVPSTGIIHLSGLEPVEALQEISIFTLSGILLKKVNYYPFQSDPLILNTQPIADGMYLLRITAGSSVFYKKMIIKK